MNQEHHPKGANTFNRGAKPDISKQDLGSEANGLYVDARNARINSVDGDTGQISKIKGESVVYENNTLSPDYVCIGSTVVNNRKIEFWASPISLEDPAIRIDGNIMVQSDNLPWISTKPLQIDINESCGEGEVFTTDDATPPLIFNIGDIITSFNSGSEKYFEDYTTASNEINLSKPLDILVFKELVALGGGGGLPTGVYSYSFRYTNEEGDRTNWAEHTPLIPVLSNVSSASNQYPYVKTSGGVTNVSSPTSYGISLKYRVTNINNYDFIEIKRRSWNSEGGIGSTPEDVIVAKIDIADGEISVREL